ncbi:phosphonate metabolism protein PhnP [Sedimenticola hydrogenitrophicus]|uniref:phosphonate metabolism protein PhnP n=1 Tax=Sedimenticola hydrogenitrophicus TaxID=2967975 RepID=UPI0023B1EFF9|nr:phosphonate metabolism protein PhnP [Sedimenticola hydrogenitrophicus]
MRLTFLGTGAAGGVPFYGCTCPACERARGDSRYARRPCSALLESGETRILIDAGLMNLHERFPPGTLTAIVLTHYHPDHVQGLFHLRWGVGDTIPVMGPPDSAGCADLYRNPGLLRFQVLRKFEPLNIGPFKLTPLPLIHSKPTFGYAIEDTGGERIAYLTDTVGLPSRTKCFLREWRPVDLVIDCTHPPQAPSPGNHNDWDRALATIDEIGSARAWMTHLDHSLDAWLLEHRPTLPQGVRIATDNTDVTLAG